MNLETFENRITNNPTLSVKAREVSQKVLSNLRTVTDEYVTIQTDKLILGEIARACEIEAVKIGNSMWQLAFTNDSGMVWLECGNSLFDVLGEALNPKN